MGSNKKLKVDTILKTETPSEEWRKCSYQSNRPIADLFIAFKTPVSSKVQHPPDCRFTPKSLLDSFKIQGGKIAMWIDTTIDTNFYDCEEVTKEGTVYVKFGICGESACRRFNCAPHANAQTAELFNRFCNDFLQSRETPQHYIGVHCNLGYNVTGYFICNFLIQHMGFTLESALAEFSSCRPNGIYNQHLLNDLTQRFGKDTDLVVELSLPPKIKSQVDHDKKKTHEPKFVDGVQGVIPVQDKAKLLKLQRKVQDICGWTSGGFPGRTVVTLNSENMALLKEREYLVHHKANGRRYMMFIQGNKDIYFVDRENYFFHVNPQENLISWETNDTLLDGEFIVDKNGQAVFIIFDIISYDGKSVKELPFTERFNVIKDMSEMWDHGFLTKNIQLEKTVMHPVSGIKKMLDDQPTLNFETDGLIFSPADYPYECGSCDLVLKWKPPELSTVDFLLRIEETRIGDRIVKIGKLHVGRLDPPLGQIELDSDLEKLDGKIIECLYQDSKWKFLLQRTERVSPNMYTTAMEVITSILDPVKKEDLLNFSDQMFKKISLN